jgi:membrane protease YdiL (CAAX protease family)
MRVEARASAVFGILLTSLLFSAAHYIGFKFDLATFLFRFYAGAFFALVYRHRGFGIAAGAHALYDVLVELLSRVF